MTKPATPLSARERAGLRTDISLQKALDHIDRVYGQRILYVYGLGLVAGFVMDEFNHFMDLRPPAERGGESDFGELLFGALKLLLAVPGLHEGREIIHYIIVVGEGAHTVGKALTSAHGSSEEEPDEGMAAYLRDEAIKMPIFQRILAERYRLEQERLDARSAYLDKLDVALQDKKFAGTPVSLAVEMNGPAPANLDPKAVYKIFTDQRAALFKEMMKAYVARYVTVALWRKQYQPGQPYEEQWFPIIGMNNAQWRALYARFGIKPDNRTRMMIYARTTALDLRSKFVERSQFRYAPAPDPILTNVSDLWKLWGAKLLITDLPWFGKPVDRTEWEI